MSQSQRLVASQASSAYSRAVVTIRLNIKYKDIEIGIGDAANLPAYVALALDIARHGGKAEEIVDEWLHVVLSENYDDRRITREALEHSIQEAEQGVRTPFSCRLKIRIPAVFSKAIQHLLAARQLVEDDTQLAIDLFNQNPSLAEPIIRSWLVRLRDMRCPELLEGLVAGSGVNTQLGALLASDFISSSSPLQRQVSNHILAIFKEGTLPITQRLKVGLTLSQLGDPRDLCPSLPLLPTYSHSVLPPIRIHHLPILSPFPRTVSMFSQFWFETMRCLSMKQDGNGIVQMVYPLLQKPSQLQILPDKMRVRIVPG
ncbi:uncharacterized protein EAF01_011735 [Botrytis porri]|uniref:Uncharacterized protein n=1 Tax=Botrytis porri TaxID=87229 RepID=A0A4Z1K8P7_9HELO|nr:uncharacterized protein EAF01_011735 [Botrytis porri]KAF7882283.1 hypothetical protein EAF01_011735 [Botrytis porri]TGO82471.1 hypothetical protein BPOR_0824g00030 [Botrytis porri]